jgi:hypothetical protein
MPSPKIAVEAARAASSVLPTAASASSARRSSALPTIAGAARRRIEAPVVAPNRSAISVARVGSAEGRPVELDHLDA